MNSYIHTLQTGGAERDKYPYMGDLLAMERMVPSARPALRTSKRSPLLFAERLGPGSRGASGYAAFIVRGVQNGFRIGFDYSLNSCTSVGRNMILARIHPQQIQEYIKRELAAGRVIHVCPLSDTDVVQISCFGME